MHIKWQLCCQENKWELSFLSQYTVVYPEELVASDGCICHRHWLEAQIKCSGISYFMAYSISKPHSITLDTWNRKLFLLFLGITELPVRNWGPGLVIILQYTNIIAEHWINRAFYLSWRHRELCRCEEGYLLDGRAGKLTSGEKKAEGNLYHTLSSGSHL